MHVCYKESSNSIARNNARKTDMEILEFLYNHGYSQYPIIQRFIGYGRSGTRKVIKRLVLKNLVSTYKFNQFYAKIDIIGISLSGVHFLCSSNPKYIFREHLSFYPYTLRWESMPHNFMTQEAHILIKKNKPNLDFYTERLFLSKGLKIQRNKKSQVSDVICIDRITGDRIAIEIEINSKKKSRYEEILYGHLMNIANGHYQEVFYAICGDKFETIKQILTNAAKGVDTKEKLLNTDIRIKERLKVLKIENKLGD